MAKRTGKTNSVSFAAQTAPPRSVRQAVAHPSHQQIAERAYFIWINKGRPHGQDAQIWREAESQLRQLKA